MNTSLNPDKKEVGKRIREIRKSLNDSMAEFGRKIDKYETKENKKTKSGTVSNWETGKNMPNDKRLSRIAEIGHTTVGYILYGAPYDYVYKLLRNDFAHGGQFFKQVDFAKKLYDTPYSKVSIEEFENDDDDKIIKLVAERMIKLFKGNSDDIYNVDYEEILEQAGKEVILIIMERDISLENIISEHIDAIESINPKYYNFSDFDSIEEIADFLSLTETDLSIDELLKDATYHYYKDKVYKKKNDFFNDLEEILDEYNNTLKKFNMNN